jgi:diketogulonate reductase-like aldo/keto reductase
VSVSEQVKASLASTFTHLRPRDDPASAEETYLDCLVIHSPLSTPALTLEAWRTLETYVPSRIKALGISNCPLATLQSLWTEAKVKPSAVQNRFYDRTNYDTDLRAFCGEKGIVFQSFWTLTGNRSTLLVCEPVTRLSKEAGVTKEVALYALVMELGVAVLNGTTNEAHMKADLKEVANVRNWTFVYGEKWREIVEGFKGIVENGGRKK